MNKYAQHAASSLLKLNSKFHSSKLDLVGKDQEKWISNLEELQLGMIEVGLNGNLTDKEFTSLVMNNVLEECDVSSNII